MIPMVVYEQQQKITKFQNCRMKNSIAFNLSHTHVVSVDGRNDKDYFFSVLCDSFQIPDYTNVNGINVWG